MSEYEGNLMHMVGREMDRVGKKSLCGLSACCYGRKCISTTEENPKKKRERLKADWFPEGARSLPIEISMFA
jgi:hypothetical protein